MAQTMMHRVFRLELWIEVPLKCPAVRFKGQVLTYLSIKFMVLPLKFLHFQYNQGLTFGGQASLGFRLFHVFLQQFQYSRLPVMFPRTCRLFLLHLHRWELNLGETRK